MKGHLRPRGKHSWEIKFDAGADATGKRRIRYHSFRGTKREAQIELAKLLTQHAAGEGVDPSKATVAEFLDRWCRDWAAIHTSPKTSERYGQLIKHVERHLGTIRVQRLRPEHLAELYAKLLKGDRPLSKQTVTHVHRVVHRALGHAAIWGVVSRNVAGLVKPPPVEDSEIIIFTQDQIAATLNYLNGRTLRSIVSFLLGTGCRRGEALALRWKDVDFATGVVRIERSVEQTMAGGMRFKSPKTKHGRRNVTISPWLVAELKAHRTRQQERRLSLGVGNAAPDDLVFATWDGSPRSPNSVTLAFAKTMRVLGIGCTMHSLRHTHVSQLIAAGVDVLTISRRIGHAKPSITLNVYSHILPNSDAKAADVIETAFANIRWQPGGKSPPAAG